MKKNWTNAWLEYPFIKENESTPLSLFQEWNDTISERIIEELELAMNALYHRNLVLTEQNNAALCLLHNDSIPAQGYQIKANHGHCTIESSSAIGALYGVFALLRQLQLQQISVEELHWDTLETPSNPLRMLNHWDNMTGDIERGYSGNSFFFENNEILTGERIQDYARMIASIGINGVVINNVNVAGAAIELISERYYSSLRTLQTIFESYGIRLFLCIEFSAPIPLGGLSTADPCDPQVQQWWKDKADEIWKHLPNFGGFMIKADSEGRPGPFTYGRNHADGANMLADAVAPHGGIIIWRCFVYNCKQDWRDTKTDRAKACYNHYMPLDGQFRENVILQIKNGPMDFQVREPVSPLFGGLKHTNMMLEVQVAQEYTGQQRHVCYLIPWFKQILAQDMYCNEAASTMADLVSTRSYHNPYGGIAAVTNTGNDANWTGHDLAAANLYGFGRMTFDTNVDAQTIAKEWIRLTFGTSKQVETVILNILMQSWPAYEKYTAPLGIGWMCNPSHHYGPNVDGYEYDRWGTYHRADWKGIGVDRTAQGTNFVSQYAKPLADLYGNLETCPEELVLFFHHLNYDYVLKSGKTVLQHIYDTHFEGAEMVDHFVSDWETLEGLVKPEVYERVHARLLHQQAHSYEWRDVINTYFYRRTGIADANNRKIYG